MSAATQKRMLTATNSKLTKIDIAVDTSSPVLHILTADMGQAALRKEEAWASLPVEIRQSLYNLLPAPQGNEPAHDVAIHPMRTLYRPYIEEELRRWQTDLQDGREARKWREEALQAGRDRVDGKFDEVRMQQRVERLESKADDPETAQEGNGNTDGG